MISYVTRFFSVLCLVETGVMGDARLCTFEINGEPNIYVCRRNEQCCKVGCCLSPSFQFYQLWYYWLMVIFMLVVCSGGQWWYKYWVGEGERSGGAPTVMVRGVNNSNAQPPPRPRMGVVASSLVASSSTSNSIPTSFTLIHQICKPHHYHSRGGGKMPSPYDQIYGPPPSYESVIGNQPSSTLPAYSASPEPQNSSTRINAGGDPLGAVEHTPMRGQCPTYSQSQLDQCGPRQNEPEPCNDTVEPSPSHAFSQEDNANQDNTPSHVSNQDTSSITDNENSTQCDNTASPQHNESTSATPADSQVQSHHSSQCLEHQQH